MLSLRLLILSVTLLPSLWAEQGAGSSVSLDKRFSINMMDPLTRRSALDKNFVRFGRSGGMLNVNREGRARSDSFVRFGRGEDEEEDGDEVISPRDARGRTDFIRFGRGGGNSGFIRFGRGRNDNFVRFGRARQDSFIRFGKNDHAYETPLKEDYVFHRLLRGGNGPKGHNTNFVRFGKRDPENDEEIVNAYKNGLNFDLDEFRKENLARIARLSNRNKGDSFIRFGREPLFDEEPSSQFGSQNKENKYYSNPQNEEYNEEGQTSNSEPESSKSTSTNPESSSDSYSTYDQSGHELSRQKRSVPMNDLDSSSTDSPDLSPFYNYPSPLAGLPNFIIGPELSVLPQHSKSSGKKIDDKNFIRLG